jgi:hypothetical protein
MPLSALMQPGRCAKASVATECALRLLTDGRPSSEDRQRDGGRPPRSVASQSGPLGSHEEQFLGIISKQFSSAMTSKRRRWLG